MTEATQKAITCPKCSSEKVQFSEKRQAFVCIDCLQEFTIEKKVQHRRIFLSYGHDEYATLAEQLKKDLQERGHEVWFDLDRLKPGGDWEKYIEQGLEWVSGVPKEGRFILLMTPHSVRRSRESNSYGFCLNEISRALERNLTIIPVMVVQCEPPLSICRTQWLDMRDCMPVQERKEKYESKFARLLEALEEDRIDFEGVQMRLIQRLQPLPFEADILPHLARFTGRKWVFDRIDTWLADTKASRVFWVTGKPGVGKTAIAAWLCINRGEIAAFHLCRHGHVEKSNPRRAILSIAYQLSSQLPDYQENLNKLTNLEQIIAVDSPKTLFDNLIVQPLTAIPRPGRNIVVLIDALDEATIGAKNELASFIASEFDKTPDWMRLIITSRPEPEVTHPLQALTPYVLDASTPENEQDLREFLRRELKIFTGGKEVEQHVIDTIIRKSEGIFLYVEWIRRELTEKRLSLDKLDKFPKGLGGVYAQFFERKFPDINNFKRNYRQILELIASAREPMEVEYLASILGWSVYDKKEILDALGSLFSVSNNRIQPFHKSVLDWLTDPDKAGNYFISAEEGHKHLADHGWKEYKGGIDRMSRYSVVHLPAHLSLVGKKEELRKLLFDFGWIHAKLEASDANSLIKDYDYISDDQTLCLVQGAIRLSAHFITQDKTLLRSQLYGRMMSQDSPEIKSLLNQIQKWRDIPWLRPLVPSLISPGSPLIRTLAGHATMVNAIAVLPDGKHAISASNDTTLKVWDLEGGDVVHTLRGHTGDVNAVAVSPDGKRAISASWNDPIKVWDIESEREIHTLTGHTSSVSAITVLPDGKRAISGSWDNTLKVWDIESGNLINTLIGHTGGVYAVSLLPDGKRVISASEDNTIKVWDIESGKEIYTLAGHAVSVLPEGRCAISASDKTLKVWDTESGELIHTLEGHSDYVNAVSVLPDGKHAISASYDKTLKVWDIESAEEIHTLTGHTDRVVSVAVVTGGKRAISVSTDKTLKVWDIESGKEIQTFTDQADPVRVVAVLPDGKSFISAYDNTLKIWDIEGKKEMHTFRGHTGAVYSIAVLPDGKRAISGSWDNTLKVWDIESGNLIDTLIGHTGGVYAVSLLPDGKRAISASEDNTLKVWDTESGNLINTLAGHTDSVIKVVVTPDGKRALSASSDNTLRVWDIESAEVIHKAYIGSFNAVFPDGKRAISTDFGRHTGYTVKVWDIESTELINTLTGHTDMIYVVAVLPDGKRVISASNDKTLKVWDMERKKEMHTLRGHTGGVHTIAVVPDGKHAISASLDNTIKVWDLQNGKEIYTIAGHHTSMINAIAALPDGERFISASEHKTLRIWDLESGKVIAGFGGDSTILSWAILPDGKTIIAGEASGGMHFLRLEGAA